MKPRLVLLLTLLVAASTSVFLAACGGDDAPSNAQDVLEATFSGDKPIDSGVLDAKVQLDLQGVSQLGGPVDLRLNGPFKSNGAGKLPAFDLDVTLGAAGATFTAGAVSTGDQGFLKFQGKSYDVGKDVYEQFRKGYEEAAKNDKGEEQQPLSALGVDPRRWLTDAKLVGDEEVGGADTQHVAATVDVPKLLEDVDRVLKKAGSTVGGATGQQVPQSLSAEERKAIQDAVKKATFDVWSGKDDQTLRRMKVSVTFDVPEAQRQQVGGLTGGTVVLDVTISELNEDQEIKAPSGALPLEQLTGQLNGALGSLGGLGGTGSGSSGSGSSGSGSSGGSSSGSGSSSGDTSKYLECLNEAGGDLQKVQECAALVGG